MKKLDNLNNYSKFLPNTETNYSQAFCLDWLIASNSLIFYKKIKISIWHEKKMPIIRFIKALKWILKLLLTRTLRTRVDGLGFFLFILYLIYKNFPLTFIGRFYKWNTKSIQTIPHIVFWKWEFLHMFH